MFSILQELSEMGSSCLFLKKAVQFRKPFTKITNFCRKS